MLGINEPIFNGTEDQNTMQSFSARLPDSQIGAYHPMNDPVQTFPVFRNIQDRLLPTLLDAVPDISLCQQGNVSATMACLKDDKGTLETRLYIVFNHEDDEAARRCPQHLQVIFNMLRQVPYKPPAIDGSPKVIANELENDFTEICRAIHNYSFEIFLRIALPSTSTSFSDIRRYIDMDQTCFTPQDCSTLVTFLEHVDMIIMIVNAQTTKQLLTISMKMLLSTYSYWTEHNLLPKDSLADNKVTLLDEADAWLADGA